jgi:excisionase family DNA binding protein
VNVSPRVVSVPDAAVMVGLGESTVWAKLASGDIKSFRLGGRRMIRVEEIERFLAAAEAA